MFQNASLPQKIFVSDPIFAQKSVKVKGSRNFLTTDPQREFKSHLLFLYIYLMVNIIFPSLLTHGDRLVLANIQKTISGGFQWQV